MVLPFGPEDPPEEPPTGVVRPLVWRLSRRMWADHALGAGDACRACEERWPCRGRRVAERGLLVAMIPPPPPGARRYLRSLIVRDRHAG